MQADQTLLYQHVEFLTTLRPFRHHLNVASLDRVCDYMKQEFTIYGLQVSEQPFEVSGLNYRNVIASYNSGKRRRLIVGAHYDVCGDQPGADDNGRAAGISETCC
jgi:acetylornithine deacetylase/succinyl-diaminopimelate desuccinylase-like protein